MPQLLCESIEFLFVPGVGAVWAPPQFVISVDCLLSVQFFLFALIRECLLVYYFS